MANNRIYIRCKACGQLLPLGKRYLSEYFYQCNDKADLYDRLNDFYLGHIFCNDNGPDCFEIAYEYTPEFKEEDTE